MLCICFHNKHICTASTHGACRSLLHNFSSTLVTTGRWRETLTTQTQICYFLIGSLFWILTAVHKGGKVSYIEGKTTKQNTAVCALLEAHPKDLD